ncbi:PIN domain-containing protein [Candidatus Parcubacteria bacterium]|nr:MAG: PIN domain-containing protein [Candidatus Parcubacteria bacterium]
MAAVIHLDTHVVAWLYAGLVERIPARGRKLIEAGVPIVSPMAVLELEYLYEIGRTKKPARVVFSYLQRHIGLETSQAPFPEIIETASSMKWTRDPFDRIIAATAKVEGARLLTADEQMLRHFPAAFWK